MAALLSEQAKADGGDPDWTAVDRQTEALLRGLAAVKGMVEEHAP
jgi:hypothetical protein